MGAEVADSPSWWQKFGRVLFRPLSLVGVLVYFGGALLLRAATRSWTFSFDQFLDAAIWTVMIWIFVSALSVHHQVEPQKEDDS
jgi:hypothetical protein